MDVVRNNLEGVVRFVRRQLPELQLREAMDLALAALGTTWLAYDAYCMERVQRLEH